MQVPAGLETLGPYYITGDGTGGDELSPLALTIDVDGELIDLSGGWTFALRVAAISSTTVGAVAFTKTDGFSGSDSAPNLIVAWDSGTADLNSLTARGRYLAQVVGDDGAGHEFTRQFLLDIRLRI